MSLLSTLKYQYFLEKKVSKNYCKLMIYNTSFKRLSIQVSSWEHYVSSPYFIDSRLSEVNLIGFIWNMIKYI